MIFRNFYAVTALCHFSVGPVALAQEEKKIEQWAKLKDFGYHEMSRTKHQPLNVQRANRSINERRIRRGVIERFSDVISQSWSRNCGRF